MVHIQEERNEIKQTAHGFLQIGRNISQTARTQLLPSFMWNPLAAQRTSFLPVETVYHGAS